MAKLAAGTKAFGFVGVADEGVVLDALMHDTLYRCELMADYGMMLNCPSIQRNS